MSEPLDLDVLAVILDVGLMLENAAVFQSQIGDQLIALRAAGLRVGMMAVSRDPYRFARMIGDRLAAAGVGIHLIEDRGFLGSLWLMARRIRALRAQTRVARVYVRGLWGPVVLALANPFDSLPYVYDVRGSLEDEARAVGMPAIKRLIYTSLESWGIKRSARATAVTEPLARQIGVVHGKSPVLVVPSCVNVGAHATMPEVARRRRQALGFDLSQVVLVYSGGLSYYQQVPAMLALWRRMLDERDVRYLLLTNDTPHSLPALVGDLTDFGSRLQHLSLQRHEVPPTLAAADVGFMLRDSRELNRVASPVKFAEYLSAGLAIVGSPGTGDASGLIEAARIGVLVDPHDLDAAERRVRMLLAQVRAERDELHARALELARRRYDWAAYHEIFLDLYRGHCPRGTR